MITYGSVWIDCAIPFVLPLVVAILNKWKRQCAWVWYTLKKGRDQEYLFSDQAENLGLVE